MVSFKKTLALVLCILMAAGCMTTVSAEETDSASRSILDAFSDPSYTEKPMARFSFADATAGIDDEDTIEEYITSMAEAGFGGAEVLYLVYDNETTNEQASYAGFGTEAWRELLKKVYRAANAIEDGFLIDLTSTANWPGLINTIDGNDDESSQEVSISYTKITAEDLENGTVTLNLPETKTKDGVGFFGVDIDIEDTCRFIYTDTLVSANIVQVSSVKDIEEEEEEEESTLPAFVQAMMAGKPEQPYTLDFATLGTLLDTTEITISDTTGLTEYEYREIDGVIYAGSPAGIPDEEYCELMEELTGELWDYDAILNLYGEAPAEDADLSQSYNGKMDENFLRARMADWQYEYSADLTGVDIDPSELNNDEEISEGDWVVVAVFRRGTSQKYQSPEWGGSLMVSSTWVTDMFSVEGTTVIQEYWETYIFDDELLELMAENNTDISSFFEDSIETYTSTEFWSPGVMDKLEEMDYEYADYMAAILLAEFTNTEAEDGTDMVDRIYEDYEDVMGEMFLDGRVATAQAFAEKYDMTFRMETYGLMGFDINEAAAAVGLGEGEGDGDTARMFRGSLNMDDTYIASMEAMTVTGNYRMNWETVSIDLLSDLSAGYNRLIFHAGSYSKAINGFAADWPGWDPFANAHGESWGYRQIYWDSMTTITNRIARIQAVMQEGTQKVDLVVVRDSDDLNSQSSGTAFRELLNNGFSYNIISENTFDSENATVTGNQLYEDGPGYKAMIMNTVEVFSVDALNTVIGYAEAGLPIILYNCNITRINGTGSDTESDELVQAAYAQLLETENVYTATTEAEIMEVLAEIGVDGYAQYTLNNVETTLYQDAENGINVYYIYNLADPDSSDPTDIDVESNKASKESNDLTDIDIVLTGEGTPYVLDSMTGDITQATEYTDNGDGTFTVHIDALESWDETMIALVPDGILDSYSYVTSVDQDASTYDIARGDDGELLLNSTVPGTYTVSLSDGTSVTVTIEAEGETLDLTGELWSLVLDSYGPTYEDAHLMVDELGIQTVDPSDTTITTIDFGELNLTSWMYIEATQEQLDLMGVTGMEEVSGKGYYTITFDWDGSNGQLHYAYGNDQITAITVNGSTVTEINPLLDCVDISEYLVEGENTLIIELCSTLYNRALVEEYVYEEGQGDRTMFQMCDPFEYGLTEAYITSYSQAALTE